MSVPKDLLTGIAGNLVVCTPGLAKLGLNFATRGGFSRAMAYHPPSALSTRPLRLYQRGLRYPPVLYDKQFAAGQLRLAGRLSEAVRIEESYGLFNRAYFRVDPHRQAVAAYTRSGTLKCAGCGEPIPETISVNTKNGIITQRGYALDHSKIIWADRVIILKNLKIPITRALVKHIYNLDLRPMHQVPCNANHSFEPPRLSLRGWSSGSTE